MKKGCESEPSLFSCSCLVPLLGGLRGTAIELSPAAGPHWQALNLNRNRNLARLRILEIKSKITIKIRKKPFRLNSMAVLRRGEGCPKGGKGGGHGQGEARTVPEFHALWCGIASWGLTSAATIRDQRFDIFARAASRILRSRSVRLWMPCAEILSRIGSTSLLIKSGPAVTSDETFCPLLRNELPGARTLAGACEPREFRNRDHRPTQRSDS